MKLSIITINLNNREGLERTIQNLREINWLLKTRDKNNEV
jgi:hypothetical protein